MRVYRYMAAQMLGCAALFVTACQGSSQPATSVASTPQVDVATVERPLVAGLTLGEGYNLITDADTNNVCVSMEDVKVSHDTRQPFYSFYVEALDEVEYEFERVMTLDVPFSKYSAEVDTLYTELLGVQSKRLFSVLVTLPTVEQKIGEYAGALNPDSPCSTGLVSDFDDFVSQCGTAFLRSERRGAYVLLVADLTNTPIGERELIEQLLHLNVKDFDHTRNFNDVLQAMHAKGVSVDWFVKPLTSGVALPTFANGQRISSTQWDDYVDEIDAVYLDPNGAVVEPSFGEVLLQDIMLYRPEFFAQCGEGIQLPEEFSCYNETTKYAAQYRDKLLSRSFVSRMEGIKWFLDNDDYDSQGAPLPNPTGRVRYSNYSGNAALAYQEVWERYQACKVDVANIAAQCEERMRQGSPNLCDYCPSLDDPALAGCDPMSFFSADLPDATINPILSTWTPPQHYFANHNNPLQELSTDNTFCAFSGLGGNMDHDQDRVVVGTNPEDTLWRLRVSNNEDSPVLYGHMHCVPKDRFNGATKGTSFEYSFAQATTTSSATQYIADSRFAPLIQGSMGIYDGGGEFVRIYDGSGPTFNRVELQTQTTENLTGYAGAFGVLNPAGNTPRYLSHLSTSTNSNYEFTVSSFAAGNNGVLWDLDRFENSGPYTYDTQLVPEKDGFCVLTELTGPFNSGSHFIKLLVQDGYWYLRMGSTCRDFESNFWATTPNCLEAYFVRASVKCYAYDQSQ